MTITADDLKFFAAQTPLDSADGGGQMTGTAVQDGIENNVFPDIAPGDRTSGRVQMRKLFVSVVSVDNDVLATAAALVETPPEDPAVSVVLFQHGGQATLRGAAVQQIEVAPYTLTPEAAAATPLRANIDGTTVAEVSGLPGDYPPGTQLFFFRTHAPSLGAVDAAYQQFLGRFVVESEGGTGSVSGVQTVFLTFTAALPPASAGLAAGGFNSRCYVAVVNPAAAKCVGAALTTATSGTDSVEVASVEAQLVPEVDPYPTAVNGMLPGGLVRSAGKVPIFRVGETVLISDGTNSETAILAGVDPRGELTFADDLVHSYAAGAVVSSCLDLGDIQALAGISFSQQTWTRVFSDTRIGNTISAAYNQATYPIEVNNAGAATERWAIVFTSTTAFRLIGELVGEIATGTVGTDFSPVNPITGEVYFTIASAGWGSGWATGNVLRFNTTGARAPVWAVRTVSPSTPDGLDSATLQIRGGVDA